MGGSRIVVLACAAAAAALAGGCGAAQTVSRTIDPVAQAADVTAATGAIEVRLHAFTLVAGKRVPVTGTGVVSTRGSVGRFVLDAHTATGRSRFVELYDGDVLYLRNPALARQFGKRWARLDVKRLLKGGASVAFLDPGSSAAQSLRVLAGASGARAVGKATVEGVRTTHYRVTARRGTARMPVDVWIDARHRVRRLSIAVDAPARTRVTMDFVRFGVPLHLSAPPASQTHDFTDQARSALARKGG